MLRAQSHPALTSVGSSLPKSASSGDIDGLRKPQRVPRRLGLMTTAPSPNYTPIHSPAIRNDDAFHLGGFFSPTNDRGGLSWLNEEDEAVTTHTSSTHAIFSAIIEEGAEDLSRQKVSKLIQKEDKLGILSLHIDSLLVNPLSGSYSQTDSPLMSPYAADDALDHDALYAMYSKRRRTPQTSRKNEIVSPTSELFRPEEEEEDVKQETWLNALQKIVTFS